MPKIALAKLADVVLEKIHAKYAPEVIRAKTDSKTLSDRMDTCFAIMVNELGTALGVKFPLDNTDAIITSLSADGYTLSEVMDFLAKVYYPIGHKRIGRFLLGTRGIVEETPEEIARKYQKGLELQAKRKARLEALAKANNTTVEALLKSGSK